MNQQAYRKIVEKAKEEWRGFSITQKNITLKWYENSDEINLWTYWQGYQVEKVDILLVGQDWGEPVWSMNTTPSQDAVILNGNIQKMRKGDSLVHYLDGIHHLCRTDENLIALFSELENNGTKLYSDIRQQKYDNLFFTNFSLGYRVGKSTGGMTKKILMKDAKIFKKLVLALEPQIIICLGKLVYTSVLDSLFDMKKKVGNYNNLLNSVDGTRICRTLNQREIVVYGMAHCGYLGASNRRRNSNKTGMELMKQDWRKVNQDIQRMGIQSKTL